MKLWIARDKDGALFLFEEKPIKYQSWFDSESGNSHRLNDNLFPEVTFENSPQEVKPKLIEK